MCMIEILAVIGGLALFLYGIYVIGEGLAKFSGGKWNHVLETLTAGKLGAVLFGAVIAAVTQSSQATAAMVVGFVHSGIIKLTQAIGVIMGVHVGATAASWIYGLSGTGWSFSSFFFPAAAVVGILLLLFSGKDRQKDLGTVFMGFSLLMFGMRTMSHGVTSLAALPEFDSVLLLLTNPVSGIAAGLLLTVVLQSSSASAGILQALSVTGAIRYSMAVPVIIGQNAGICITAILASVGTGKDARRAALVHLYFTLLSAVLFTAGFYGLHKFAGLFFLQSAISPLGIALVHTLYNLCAVVILLPFSSWLEKLACLTVKDKEKAQEKESKEEKEAVRILDSRFLNTPGFALEQCKTAAIEMAGFVKESLLLAMDLMEDYHEEKAQRVIWLEETADRYEDKIGNYLVKLTGKHLSGQNGREWSVLLHGITDLERISDHARNLAETAAEIQEKKVNFSGAALEELTVLTNAIRDMMNSSFLMFQEEDIGIAGIVKPMREVIGDLYTEIRKNHVKRLQKGKCTMEQGFIFSDILTDYVRIADHCAKIALCLLQSGKESFILHGGQDAAEDSRGEEYKEEVKRLGKHYKIP